MSGSSSEDCSHPSSHPSCILARDRRAIREEVRADNARIEAFLARYPGVGPTEWPAGSTDLAHTHGGNRFWTFEGTSLEFCSACAIGLHPDPRVVNDGAMDPRD